MGDVVEALMDGSLSARVPLNFKFVNVAADLTTARMANRSDRIVIDPAEDQVPFVEGLLRQIHDANRDAFDGRAAGGFAQPIAEGIAASDRITDEQREAFPSDSVNSLRAKMLLEATKYAASQAMLDSEFMASSYLGPTDLFAVAEKRLEDAYHRVFPHYAHTTPHGTASKRLPILKTPYESLKHLDAKEQSVADDVLLGFAKDIFPRMPTEIILPYYKSAVLDVAPKYGIDPDNLAKNIPIQQ